MVDQDRRRFVKHLGMVGAAGVVGLGIAQFSTRPHADLIDELEETEQQRGFRRVWATKRDQENFAVWAVEDDWYYEDYLREAERLGIFRCDKCGGIYDVTAGREARFDELSPDWECTRPECAGATKADFRPIGIAFISGGQPFVNEPACAYHYDSDLDGYETGEEGVYCSMPCRTICPVEAIEKKTFGGLGGKKGPVVRFEKEDGKEGCIGCGRCHKICGYNCIEWVNKPYEGPAAGGDL